MENLTPKPTKGLVIVTSYVQRKRSARFSVYDIEAKKYVIKNWSFENVTTSDNVIGLFAICKTLEWCVMNDCHNNVYCANEISFGWAKKRSYKTKISCPDMVVQLEEVMEILFRHDFSIIISFWEPEWGTIKETISYLESDGLPF